MKKTTFILSFLLSLTATAQQPAFTKTPALGIHLAFFDITGADSLQAFGKNMKPGLAIHYQNDLSKQLSYNVQLAGTYLDFPNRKGKSLGDGKKQLLLEMDLTVQARLLPAGALLNPYAQGGIGISSYNGYYGSYIPAGLGCRINLTPDLFVLLNSQYRIPLTNTQHRHFYHGIGLAGVINRKKTKKPPPAPPVTVVKRIPPPVDTDGDGIVDTVDQCPTVIGLAKYKGCPPPDRDGDHVNDEEDACPDVKGLARNKGCPDIEDSVKVSLSKAAKQVFFETGSYTLQPASYAALDEVFNILKNNAALHLFIEGHTDNTGTPEKNLVLSNDRANAVVVYLHKKGIQSSRLHATGYGQDRPVANNNTAAGRAANRRVQFDAKYQL